MECTKKEKVANVKGGDGDNDNKDAIAADLFDVKYMSNRCDVTEDEIAHFGEENANRRAKGYAKDGSLGGPFSKKNPPPGLKFKAYNKGCTGIVWETAH